MIKIVDFQNDNLMKELFGLQKISYIIEAKLIDYYEIPPLKETFEEFLDCGETFLGYWEDDELLGALSYTIEKEVLTICRMIVHPNHFRKGIAQQLLTAAEEKNAKIQVYHVSTGKDNFPAKKLYQKNGYVLIEDIEVEPGFFISNFEKNKTVN
ncbi:GNAT family N-acetyltransferase [Neobacillus sp. K501]